MTRWFHWSSWFTDKLEVWLEARAADGWHLVKADRLMLRFHFVRGTRRTVRYCVDYPHAVNDEYYTLFKDTGWELAANGQGWYIWRAEYSGNTRPEVFNDVQPLIDRHKRLLAVFFAALVSQIGLFATKGYNSLFGSPIGRILFVPYLVLVLFIFVSATATYKQIKRLEARRA